MFKYLFNLTLTTLMAWGLWLGDGWLSNVSTFGAWACISITPFLWCLQGIITSNDAKLAESRSKVLSQLAEHATWQSYSVHTVDFAIVVILAGAGRYVTAALYLVHTLSEVSLMKAIRNAKQ